MALQGYIEDFQVLGTDYPTADGTAVRDYIHVTDLAQAHKAALDALWAGSPSGRSLSSLAHMTRAQPHIV